MKFSEYYYSEESKELFLNCVKQELTLLTEEESPSVEIGNDFIARLLTHLEKRFPNFGEFDQQIGNEIRKYMKGDNSYVKRVKQRIHEIINKSKEKFLYTIADRIQKIKVQPKAKPQISIIHKDPLMASDETITGDI